MLAPATKYATHLLKTKQKHCACHTNRLLTRLVTCWNVTKYHACHAKRLYAKLENSKKDTFCRTSHGHGHMVADGHRRLRTVGNACVENCFASLSYPHSRWIWLLSHWRQKQEVSMICQKTIGLVPLSLCTGMKIGKVKLLYQALHAWKFPQPTVCRVFQCPWDSQIVQKFAKLRDMLVQIVRCVHWSFKAFLEMYKKRIRVVTKEKSRMKQTKTSRQV